MNDLTNGSIARNLLQTAGFMLVGMVFQTLYFLVDLYFVGKLGKYGGRGGEPVGQPDVPGAGADADAGRGDDGADRARDRAQGPR